MLRSFVALTAAAATILPVVSANTFQLDFHKRKVAASPAKLARRQTVNSVLSNEENLYIINVTVGTPPQPLSLQLDTGSSDIWFPAANSSYCTSSDAEAEGGCSAYNSSASSTYTNPNLGVFNIEYVDGTNITGEYVSDTLIVSNATLTNQTMAEAFETDQGYGIMGIGFRADESSNEPGGFTYPNIIDVLVSEGFINTHAYSLWLDDLESSTGSILFGGVDESKYDGSLIAIPIQKDAETGVYDSFTVAWTGLTVVGGGQTSNLSPSIPMPAILDSGTTELLLPDDIANAIYNGVGVVTDADYGNIVPCDLAKDKLSFNFQFGGSSGPMVNVSVSEFVLPLETSSGKAPKFSDGPYRGKDACAFGIEPAGGDPILFGDTFLRSAYVVYDLDNLEIGMAQTNQKSNINANANDVKAFTSGGGIPDATTTITSIVASASGQDSQSSYVQSTATATGDAGVSATTRTATYSLVSATASSSASGSGSSSSSTSSSAAGSVVIPSVSRSVFAVGGITIAAFVFGALAL